MFKNSKKAEIKNLIGLIEGLSRFGLIPVNILLKSEKNKDAIEIYTEWKDFLTQVNTIAKSGINEFKYVYNNAWRKKYEKSE